ncbi:hypothetical protein EMQ25_07830 [Arsenicitalea aurantiaca]|uniref:Alpha 1,4-glycosyltransferase domain-containing protein n=1 Tax=Arsenicitalea aurantiaca TaxID=1783274 RepID=A0A433XG35_9HYPH|nr:hypothetical protein [Arsenicitalea aurantiaca]RUT33026.1 hypothetical protein EMQ25_07830 [Arsenicitalea aurantiaca]
MTEPVNMLWIGGPLGYIERLSIHSFIAAGHPVHLHLYDDVPDLPSGVRVVDGNETVPREYLMTLRYKFRDSLALAGDYFRLELQKQGKGAWVDADMVCLRPLPRDEYLFGWESDISINNAVLRLPATSPIVSEAIAAFRPGAVPKWFHWNRRRQLWMKKAVGIKFGPQQQHWAAFGPHAITWLARKYGKLSRARPISAFYPISLEKRSEPFRVGTSIEQFIDTDTHAVHLWNSNMPEMRNRRPATGSAIGSLLLQYGV